MVEDAYIVHSEVEVNSLTGEVHCWAFLITGDYSNSGTEDDLSDAIAMVAPTARITKYGLGRVKAIAYNESDAAAIKLAFPYDRMMF